jgi:hypothetical protein
LSSDHKVGIHAPAIIRDGTSAATRV